MLLNAYDTEERRQFRDTVRRFVDTEVRPYADEWDEAGDIPWELHEKAGSLGVFGFGIDEQYGGLGFDDCFMRKAWMEEMGASGANGVLAALVGRTISIDPIQKLASEEIRERVLADVVAGRKGSSLAITEPSGGSDVANLQTRAHRDGNHYVLNGS